MTKWDYFVQGDYEGILSGRGTATDFINYLNSVGQEGWELVAIMPREVNGITNQWLIFQQPSQALKSNSNPKLVRN